MLFHNCHRSKTERNSFQQSVMGPSTVPWPRPMKVSCSAGYIPQTSSLVRISHSRKDVSRIVCHEKLQTRQGRRISGVGVRLHVQDQRLDRTLWVWCGGSQKRVARAMLLKRAPRSRGFDWFLHCFALPDAFGSDGCWDVHDVLGGETTTLCRHQSYSTCRSSWAVRWRSSFSEQGALPREGNKFYSVHSACWGPCVLEFISARATATLGLQSISRAHALEFLLLPQDAGVAFEAENFQWVKMMVWPHLIQSQVSMLASEAALVSWVEELGAIGDWYQGAQQPLPSFCFLGQLHSWPSRLMR